MCKASPVTALWVADETGGDVFKVSIGDGHKIGTFGIGGWPVGMAFDGANTWVTQSGADGVSKL